jgi:O-antigen ligase
MEPAQQPKYPAPGIPANGVLGKGASRQRLAKAQRARAPQLYRLCDSVTEGVLYFMVVFSPWAFGTTQPWSTWTMNVAGFVLGALLLAKWLIRWRAGYQPVRWGHDPSANATEANQKRRALSAWLTAILATMTVLALAYCLISAANARFTYHHDRFWHEPHDNYIAWLPHSFDSKSSWLAFWEYLGLALAFWATRDWLLGKELHERRSTWRKDAAAGEALETIGPIMPEAAVTRAGHSVPMSPKDDPANRDIHSAVYSLKGIAATASLRPPLAVVLPARLRRLLWVLCINGAILAVECISQRVDGSGKLLGLVRPSINQTAESQFGPYAYRSNAAQYFNLVWPVCLGFWWMLRQDAKRAWRSGLRVGSSAYILLLPCVVLTAASPIISTSRGGAIVAAVGLVVAVFLVLLADQHGHWLRRLGLYVLLLVTLGFAADLGWEPLKKRLETVFSDGLSGRTEIYENAQRMAQEYPLYGMGPGTFAALYQLYKKVDQEWMAQVHDDWLETRITFGWVGFSLVLLMLAVVLAHWGIGAGIKSPWIFLAMIWVALAGCLIHARFDFPLQIHSILALFLLHCSLLICLARKS